MINLEQNKYYTKSPLTHCVTVRSAAPAINLLGKLLLAYDPLVSSGSPLTLACQYIPGVSSYPIEDSAGGTGGARVSTLPSLFVADTSQLIDRYFATGTFDPTMMFPKLEGFPAALPFPLTDSDYDKSAHTTNWRALASTPAARISMLLETFFTGRGSLKNSLPLSSRSESFGATFQKCLGQMRSWATGLKNERTDLYDLCHLIRYMPLATSDGRYALGSGEAQFFKDKAVTRAMRLHFAFHARGILESGYMQDTVEERDLPNSMKGWTTRFQRLIRWHLLCLYGYKSYIAAMIQRYAPFLSAPGSDDSIRRAFGPYYDERIRIIREAQNITLLPFDRQFTGLLGPVNLATAWSPSTPTYYVAPLDKFLVASGTYMHEDPGSRAGETALAAFKKLRKEDYLRDTAMALAGDDVPSASSVSADVRPLSTQLYADAYQRAVALLASGPVTGPVALATILYLAADGLRAMDRFVDDTAYGADRARLVSGLNIQTDSATPGPATDALFPVFTDGDKVSVAALSLTDLAYGAFLPAASPKKLQTQGWIAFPNIEPMFPLAMDPSRISLYSDRLRDQLRAWPTLLRLTPVLAQPASDYSFVGRDPRILRGSNFYQGEPHVIPIAYSVAQLLDWMGMSNEAFQRSFCAKPSAWLGPDWYDVDDLASWDRAAGVLVPDYTTIAELTKPHLAQLNQEVIPRDPATRTSGKDYASLRDALDCASQKLSAADFSRCFQLNGAFAYEIETWRAFNVVSLPFTDIPANPALIPFINHTQMYERKGPEDGGVLAILRVDREVPTPAYSVQPMLVRFATVLTGPIPVDMADNTRV